MLMRRLIARFPWKFRPAVRDGGWEGSRRRKGKKEESERERERASQTETGIIREGGVGQRRE